MHSEGEGARLDFSVLPPSSFFSYIGARFNLRISVFSLTLYPSTSLCSLSLLPPLPSQPFLLPSLPPCLPSCLSFFLLFPPAFLPSFFPFSPFSPPSSLSFYSLLSAIPLFLPISFPCAPSLVLPPSFPPSFPPTLPPSLTAYLSSS